MSIKCGQCKGYHETVFLVKQCHGVGEVVVTEGMWVCGENQDIYKVQRAVHGSGNLYAKILVHDDDELSGHFEYKPGGIKDLERAGRKMTLEEAKDFGALYGFCCRCGRTLTDENSIEAGIGPKCAEKFVA